LAGFGSDTTVMVRSILLRGFDQDIAEMIGTYMEEHGVKFIRKQVASKFEKTPEGRVNVFIEKDGVETLQDTYDTVLMAVGRNGIATWLNVENAGLECTKSGKLVCSESEQTKVPHIYAVGDVVEGKPELTPVAIQAGRRLVKRLFGGSTQLMDYTDIATAVFTPIEFGTLGLSEDDARKKFPGEDRLVVYHSTQKPLEWNTNPERKNDLGYIKLICDKEQNEKVVGVHLLGPNAGEVVQGLAVAMKAGMTKDHLDDCVGIHPTYAESFTTMTVIKTEGDSGLPTTGGC